MPRHEPASGNKASKNEPAPALPSAGVAAVLPIAATGAGTVLSCAILSEMFPKSASGRANGALSLLHVTATFAIQ